MSSRLIPSLLSRRLVLVGIFCVIGGVCYLRLNEAERQREVLVTRAIAAIAEGIEARDAAARATAFDRAETLAVDAMRLSPIAVDPFPMFLLKAAEELEGSAEPPTEGDTIEQAIGALARGDVADARRRFEALRDRQSLEDSARPMLYLALIERLEALARVAEAPARGSPVKDPAVEAER